MWPNQRERSSLQALHLMYQIKVSKIAIMRCFGNYACVVNMMSIHTIYIYIYVTTTTKNRSKKCFRGFKVCSDYEHTTNGGNSLPSDVLMIISKKIIEDPKHQET